MRNAVLVTAISSALALASGSALATKVQISGTHSPGEIQQACGAAYSGTLNGYGCTKPCSGGTCSVECDRKTQTCTGYVPRKGPAHPTIGGVLGPPLRGNAPAGGSSSLRAWNKPVIEEPEPVSQRPGGKH